MNYNEDARRFAQMMDITWQSCGRTVTDKPTKAFWFDKLSKYEFSVVETAFDNWLKSQNQLPTIHEIIKLCQDKIPFYQGLPAPLDREENKKQSAEVMNYVSKNMKPKTDMKAWARKIIANPSNYPAISFKLAKLALNSQADMAVE